MIVIKTKLADGIYKSHGGGQVVHHYSFTTTARNLLKAINTLHEHRTSMLRSYGNIGCGSSWMEVEGVHIDEATLADINLNESRFYPFGTTNKTRTQKAEELIVLVSRWAAEDEKEDES